MILDKATSFFPTLGCISKKFSFFNVWTRTKRQCNLNFHSMHSGLVKAKFVAQKDKFWIHKAVTSASAFLIGGRYLTYTNNTRYGEFVSADKTEESTENVTLITTNPTKTLDNVLFKPIEPYKTGMLKVSDKHEIYYEECGNPNGKPVVMLHGGPGAGCSNNMRRFHDPKEYRIILFDQRGSGRSKPYASLEENTTWDLVDDIEKLRKHLEIQKWQVFGGSWGSTLAIVYAEKNPSQVSELVLRGIFQLRQKEIDFYYQKGASFIFPDRWKAYRDAIPEEERHDFVGAYHCRLIHPDPKVRIPAAVAWTTWERTTSSLIPPNDAEKKSMEDAHFAEAFARIENHYFYNKGWFPTDNYLNDNVHKIRHIPTVIVQGRYDVVCPIVTAYEFHEAFPEADFRIIQDAGHSAFEIGIANELVAATEKFKHKQ